MRGELYLQSPDGTQKLYLAQQYVNNVLTTTASYGAIGTINRVLSKNVIITPIPDSEPIGIDLNMIESDTFRINTTWFDGIVDGSTYTQAESFFKKEGWAAADKLKPYTFIMGERTYQVMLNSWTADLTGGWGDSIPVTISLFIVASP